MYFILLPLYRAAIVSLLIAGGAEVGAENQEGETPQMYAEYRNHDTVAKLLHEAADQGMGKTDGMLDGLFCVTQWSWHLLPVFVVVKEAFGSPFNLACLK